MAFKTQFNVRTTGKSTSGFSNPSGFSTPSAPAPSFATCRKAGGVFGERFGKGLNSCAMCKNGPACPRLKQGDCKFTHSPEEIEAVKTSRLQAEIAEAQTALLQAEIAEAQTALLQAQLDALKAQAEVLQAEVLARAQAEPVPSKPSFKFNPNVAVFKPVEPVYKCSQCDTPLCNVDGELTCEICDMFGEDDVYSDEYDESDEDDIEACLAAIENLGKVAPVAPVARPFKLVLQPKSQ